MDTKRLKALRHFMLDMDGTIYLGPAPIPGAPEFIRFLRESGRQCLFFTNNPTRAAAAYSEKLGRMGIEAAPGNILTAGEATVRYLQTQTPYRRIYAVAPPSFEEELRRGGFDLDAAKPEAVVLSFDTSVTYAKLERACLLVRQGLPYVATNPDKVCPTEYGPIPDCGAIAALVETATGRAPKFIGKPDPDMARMGMAKMGAAPETTAMVGDRLYTDMRMARAADITPILVLSGETTAADLETTADAVDFVFPSVRELHAALRD